MKLFVVCHVLFGFAVLTCQSVAGQDDTSSPVATNETNTTQARASNDAAESESESGPESGKATGEVILRLDRNGDGQVDDAELATAKHLFDAVDRNNDGKIDAAERAYAKRVHERLLQKFDGNGDGRLDKLELRSAHETHRKLAADPVETPKLFDSVDRNHDGILSEAELLHARYVHQRMVQQFDENGDGKLDSAENQSLRDARDNAQQILGEPKTPFDKADRNDDGTLQKVEKEAAKRIHDRQDRNNDGHVGPREQAAAKREFEKTDRNNDGQVGPKEKEAAKSRAAKKPGGANKDVPKRLAPKLDQASGGTPGK